LFDLPELVND